MMYQLMLTLGETGADVLAVFKMYIYSDDPEIDWDSLQVWYKDVNIVDTLDLNIWPALVTRRSCGYPVLTITINPINDLWELPKLLKILMSNYL